MGSAINLKQNTPSSLEYPPILLPLGTVLLGRAGFDLDVLVITQRF
jgi:hypothetical protein